MSKFNKLAHQRQEEEDRQLAMSLVGVHTISDSDSDRTVDPNDEDSDITIDPTEELVISETDSESENITK